ncbi:MAG: hypothetical protein ACT4OL_03750 [Nitrospiraceae bacterium]
MSDQRPKRDTMSLEKATISNMWEIAALVEVLERKGFCTKQDLYDIISMGISPPNALSFTCRCLR